MPRGSSPEREHEYEELKRKFEESGRYGDRAAEVAARIVNKQRAEYGETKADKQEEQEDNSPDRDLPIDNYRHKTVAQLEPELKTLSKADLQRVELYEEHHKDRKGAEAAIQSAMRNEK